jgi:GH25 family lysozyme M1 (1,4-beta-N-acetylmuramidase)
MIGIDISNWQPTVDWPKVKAAGVTFAWFKATEGLSYVDPTFSKHATGASTVGIRWGAYHFARPDNNSPAVEVERFLSVAQPKVGQLLPVLDFEHRADLSPSAMTTWAKEWLQGVEKAIGVKPIFYTYPFFFWNDMGGPTDLKAYPLWLASYGANDGTRGTATPLFADWPIAAHQYTSNGYVDGIGQRIDMNYTDDLEKLVYTKATMTLPTWLETGADGLIYVKQWVYDFVRWRLVDGADPNLRPASAPASITQPVWKLTEGVQKIAKEQFAPVVRERDTLKVDLATVTNERNALQTERDLLAKTLDGLNTDLVAMTAERDLLLADRDKLRTDLADSQVEATTAKSELSALTLQLEKAKRNFTSWADELSNRIFG